MSRVRVVITAGHNRSAPSEALAEILHREGAIIAGVVMVSVMNPGRIRDLVRQRGIDGLVRRLTGGRSGAAHRDHRSPIARSLASHGIRTVGLRRWCRSRGVQLKVVPDLNAASAVRFIRDAGADVVAYTGGGILRAPFIEAAGRVINAHAGPLPEIRGMNAAEWSALLGCRSEVTVHFIDRGIDTGAAIRACPYDRSRCATVDELRESAVAAGIDGLRTVIMAREFERAATAVGSAKPHRQCFIMAPALLERLGASLARRAAATGLEG